MSKSKTNAKKKSGTTPKRDDFLANTVRLLRDSAGNVCSYPECYVHTHGAKSSGDGALTIGVACHIKAAAPGGPRFDEAQTKDERRHIDNGIWMCQTHSKLIDADNSAYTVETLLEWKRAAEARSNAQLNKKSFTEKDVQSASADGAINAITRMVNKGNDPLETPIVEVMKGYENDLQNLDPRFSIEVNKSGRNYTHVIQAAQDKVSVDLVLQNLDKLDNFWAAQKAFLEEGRELVVPGSHFELKGSKLFEAIQKKANDSGQGRLILGGVKKPISGNLYLRTPDGDEVFIESFICYYTSGSVRTVFEGTALEGFITVKAHCSHVGDDRKFDLTFNLEAWRGKNVLELPRFARLLKAAQRMDKGRLVFDLEVGSNAAAYDSQTSAGAEVFHEQLQWVVLYLDVARRVAELCDRTIFLNDLDFKYDLYVQLKRYLRLHVGPVAVKETRDIIGEGELEYSEGCELDRFLETSFPSQVRSFHDEFIFDLVGSIVKAPRIQRDINGVEIRYFSDLMDRSIPKLKVLTTSETTVSLQLNADDAWVVLDDWVEPEASETLQVPVPLGDPE
nr:hypothetical protein [uncultured Pseudomonas sp.]